MGKNEIVIFETEDKSVTLPAAVEAENGLANSKSKHSTIDSVNYNLRQTVREIL